MSGQVEFIRWAGATRERISVSTWGGGLIYVHGTGANGMTKYINTLPTTDGIVLRAMAAHMIKAPEAMKKAAYAAMLRQGEWPPLLAALAPYATMGGVLPNMRPKL